MRSPLITLHTGPSKSYHSVFSLFIICIRCSRSTAGGTVAKFVKASLRVHRVRLNDHLKAAVSPRMAQPVHNVALSLIMIRVLVRTYGRAMMGGKYSAEWWKKFASINQESSARRDPSNVIDDLIQATASGRPPLGGKAKTSRHTRPLASGSRRSANLSSTA
jgi:hypothetical protein